VRDALGDRLGEAADLGPMPVRGFDRPVRVWKLA
jgi:class 3 adenylate cyclase